MKNWCEQVEVLQAMSMIKKMYNLVLIVIPVVLVIVLSISFVKKVFSNDDNYLDLISTALRKFFVGVTIIFLPGFIIALLSYTMNGKFDSNLLCLDDANESSIVALQVVVDERVKAEKEYEKKENEKKAEEQKIKDNEQKIKNEASSTSGKIDPYTYVSKTFTPIVNGVQRPVEEGECMNWEDNCFCPNKTNAKGFQFIMEDTKGRSFKDTTATINSVSVKDPCGVINNRNSITVSSDVKENYEKALELLCKLKTTGINGYKINTIRTNGTYSMRLKSDRTVCSPHSYGIAIDFSSGVTIDYKGKTYDPYTGQGAKTKANYDEFVRAIGGETNENNINYIIWKYAFEPAGFEWGGEWNTSSFDPMHYEVKP